MNRSEYGGIIVKIDFENLTFEPVTHADIEPLTAVMKRAFDEDARRHLGEESGGPPGYDDGSFIRKWYFEPNVCAWKVSLSGELIGAIAVFVNDNGENFLGNMFVDTPFQDKGYGAVMWRFIESQYPNTTLWRTETPGFAKRNHHFYVNKCGFRIVRIQNPGDRYEENYIMEKTVK